MSKRPFLGMVLCYILGILLTYYFSLSWGILSSCLALGILGGFVLFSWLRHKKHSYVIYLFLVMALFAGSVSPQVYDTTHTLSSATLSQTTFTMQITNCTSSIDYTDTNKTAYYYEAKLKSSHAKENHAYVRLAIYHEMGKPLSLKPGDIIKVSGKLKPLSAPTSYGMFNEMRYGKTQGIYYKISVPLKQVKLLSHQNTPSFFLYRARKGIAQQIEKHFSLAESSLIKALLIGDRRAIPDYISDDFQKSGTIHILAISGLHISILLTVIIYLLTLLHIRKRLRHGIAIMLLIGFAVLAGASPSVMRAVICSVILLVAANWGEEEDRLNTLSLSALFLLLLNPYTLFDLSFILSYSSILGIYFFYPLIEKKISIIPFRYLKSGVALSFSAQIITLPILVITFGNISTVSILGNLLMTGVVFLVIILAVLALLLSSVPWIGTVIILACRAVIFYMLWIAKLIADLPFSKYTPRLFSGSIWLGIYALFVLALYWLWSHKHSFLRLASFCLAMILILGTAIFEIANKNVIISFVNVDQGDGAVITMPHRHYAIIDGGGTSYQGVVDNAQKHFLPFLDKQNIGAIDYAILSHFDSDHSLGVLHAIEQGRVKKLLLPYRHRYESELAQKILSAAAKQNIPILYLKNGDKLSLGNSVTLLVFSPTMDPPKNENSASLVFKLSYGNTSCLFTGDLPMQQLAALPKSACNSTILKVPHHGSKTGASAEFYQKCRAKYAIISVGENSYGHPSKEVLTLLNKRHISYYRTDQYGDISFIISQKNIQKILTFLKGKVS